MSLTKRDVEEIMGLLEDSRFDRLSLEMEGLKLELERQGSGRSSNRTSSLRQAQDSARAAPAPSPPPPPARAEPVETPQRADREGLVEVKSPLLGVFYRAPKPGEPAFVEVDSRVQEDTVVGIIEVMKLMNSARAGVAGEVVEIIGTNGEMVEHGECLMLVRPD